MTVFKSSTEIFSSRWQINQGTLDPPKKYEWLSSKEPDFEDIDFWEELYVQEGNIGVYAAWSPYVEIFLLVHYSVFPIKCYEVFQGQDAQEQVISRLGDFDIILPLRNIFVI